MIRGELIIDSFAGGGGASLGISRAMGRCPDVAINHDAAAIAMHTANHPESRHYHEDVWKVTPRQVTKGRPVGLLWASPDCTHFSRAKGGTPVKKSIRSLAWVVVRWAVEARPRVIILENVREFEDWGPLLPLWACKGCDWKGTEGQTTLVRTRRRCPRCDSRSLAETTTQTPDPNRKGLTFRRWVGRIRNLGYSVQWRVLNAADFGAPTHRRRLFLIARRDGLPIEWPEPTHGDPRKIGEPSLFGGRKLPWRTAAECIDWSVPCPSIFDRKKPLAEKTLKRIALGVKRYILDNPNPFIVPVTHTGERRSHPLNEPLPTITSAHRGEFALIAPTISSLAHGGNGTFGDSRSHHVREPMRTIHAGGGNHALITAFIAKHFGGMVGVEVDTPLPTTTARGTQNQLVAANLIHLNHGDKQWSSPDDPMRTVTTGKHAALVYSFLTKYFGTGCGQTIDQPIHTVTVKDRFAVVTVQINGEPFVITDIGMRMLRPRELARGQGFPDSYHLTGSATSQVARIGNSVCPIMAEVLVRANLVEAAAAVA